MECSVEKGCANNVYIIPNYTQYQPLLV